MTSLRPLVAILAVAIAAFSQLGCCKNKPSQPPLKGDSGSGQVSNIDFGNVPVGQVAHATLSLTNSGGIPLNIQQGSVTLTGPNAADFRLGSKFPPSVQPGASIKVNVQFAPSGTGGPESATVTVPTDGSPTATLVVQLTGNAVDITICTQPTSLDFGNVQVNGTPATLALTITNCGGSDADLTFNPVEGPQSGDFAVTGQSNGTLTVGSSLNLTVTYSPHVIGSSSADLPFTVCQGCSTPQSVNFTGVGVDGLITFSPNPVNFGSPPAGTSPTIVVTGTNIGTAPVVVTNLGTENQGSPFSVPAFGAAFPLAPQQTFTVTVTYTPTGQGNGDTDVLAAIYNVADPAVLPYTAADPLSGNSVLSPCSLAIAPAAANFGNVAPGAIGAKSVTVSNIGGTACNVSGVALDPSSDPDFALANGQATSFTVAPGANQAIAMTFSPPTGSSQPFTRKGKLDFQTGDTSNPSAVVPLTATISVSDYAGGWPKWHYDNFNTGQTQSDTSGLQGVVAWKFNVGNPNNGASGAATYINSPVVSTVPADTSLPYVVYQVGMDGTLYAIDNTGSKVWTQMLSDPSSDPHPSTPAVLKDGSLYVMSGSDSSPPNLYYLSSAGIVLFSMPYGEDGFDACPGLGNDGTLFEADDDGPASSGGSGDPYSAIAFSANNGTVSPVGGLPLPISNESERFGIAIAADNTSYWGNNGQFFGLSPPPAFAQLAGWPNGGVTVVDINSLNSNLNVAEIVSDLAIDSQTTGFLYAYSAYETSNFLGTTLAVQGNIAALDPATGAQQWLFNLPSTPLPSSWSGLQSDAGNAAPAVANDGTVYVGNSDGLYAIVGATGAKKWLFSSPNVISSPAIGGDGTIFFGCSDNNFYAVKPDGTLRFKIATGGPISSSPAIAPDGTVFFVSDDGNLYAIQ